MRVEALRRARSPSRDIPPRCVPTAATRPVPPGTASRATRGLLAQGLSAKRVILLRQQRITEETPMLRPRQPIRRFDVFPEYHRLERQRHGMPADEAKGLWPLARPGGGCREVLQVKGPRKPRPPVPAGGSGEAVSAQQVAPPERQGADRPVLRQVYHRTHGGTSTSRSLPSPTGSLRARKSYRDTRDTIRRDWRP